MRLTWLTLILALSFHAAARADVLVRVRPALRLAAGSEVTLNQLCELPAEAAPVADALKRIVVATSPARLTTPELIKWLKPVIDHARAGGLNIRLKLPRAVEITAGRDLNVETLTNELIGVWQPACADCRLEVTGLNLPQVADVRDWSIKTKPELPRGSFSVPVELIRSAGAPLTAWVSGRLAQKRRVPVARRLIQTGERIETADYAFEERDVALATDGVPNDAEITGRHARRGVRVGDVLWTGTLERERAVRRGDVVRVHAGEGGWDVAMNVTSPQDAFVGDVVSFKSIKGGGVVVGMVTGPGEATAR